MPLLARIDSPPQTSARERARLRRLPELDGLRGLLLLGMTLTHLPTRASHYWFQPLGFVGWAEGFILVSALLAGRIYGNLLEREPLGAVIRRLWIRAAKLYCYQLGLLLVAFTAVAGIAVRTHQPALVGLVDFFLARPAIAAASSTLLIYCPPLLDILPMYILFVLATPIALYMGKRLGWKFVVAPSALVWIAAQFGLKEALYTRMVQLTGLPIPLQNLGAFNLYGWQFLWVLGLTVGAGGIDQIAGKIRSKWVVATAGALAVGFFVLRYSTGSLAGIEHGAGWLLFDKWHLGALRLLNFAVLGILFVAGIQRISPFLSRPALVLLGKSSLEVFCVHLLFCFASLALVGDGTSAPVWLQVAIVAVSLSGLYTTALLRARWLESARKAAERRETLIAGPLHPQRAA